MEASPSWKFEYVSTNTPTSFSYLQETLFEIVGVENDKGTSLLDFGICSQSSHFTAIDQNTRITWTVVLKAPVEGVHVECLSGFHVCSGKFNVVDGVMSELGLGGGRHFFNFFRFFRFYREAKLQKIPLAISLLLSLGAAGCGSAETDLQASSVQLEQNSSEDPLAVAFTLFVERFENRIQHERFLFGFAPSSTLTSGPDEVRGVAELNFGTSVLSASVSGLDAAENVSIWLYRNVAAPGKSAGPDAGDEFLFVGDLSKSELANGSDGAKTLDAELGDDIRFNFDALILTRTGTAPEEAPLAIGFRTLFEKRYFREKFGQAGPSIPQAPEANTPTSDPLVGIGADVFFNEAFGGNGRTCGTCHRAENNMTIDPAFIATLPADDSLFVFETNPELADLEDGALLRGKGLIKENIDGFDDPENKFVFRGVQHTFGLADSVPRDFSIEPGHPPDELTGWSGDGAPGRGTLLEFTFGAVNQHMPQTLNRVTGQDFRLPTQLELDAVEAFQLFSGRQDQPDVSAFTLKDTLAQEGKSLFEGPALCGVCHNDAGSNVGNFDNFSQDTGVELRPEVGRLGLPADGGAGAVPDENGRLGNGRFNTQPLIEAAETAPFFHNNTAATLEDAIRHYRTEAFLNSGVVQENPAFGDLILGAEDVPKIAAFLRVLNVAENIRQTRERVEYLRSHVGPGSDEILATAIADLRDGMEILKEQSLHPDCQEALRAIIQTLEMSIPNGNAARPAFMSNALVWLDIAKETLFASNPNNDF